MPCRNCPCNGVDGAGAAGYVGAGGYQYPATCCPYAAPNGKPVWLKAWLAIEGALLGSPLSLPHEHLTGWELISELCVPTIACVAASLVENLNKKNKRLKKIYT